METAIHICVLTALSDPSWTFDSVGKRCKCWVSALAFEVVVLNDLDVLRALS